MLHHNMFEMSGTLQCTDQLSQSVPEKLDPIVDTGSVNLHIKINSMCYIECSGLEQ